METFQMNIKIYLSSVFDWECELKINPSIYFAMISNLKEQREWEFEEFYVLVGGAAEALELWESLRQSAYLEFKLLSLGIVSKSK